MVIIREAQHIALISWPSNGRSLSWVELRLCCAYTRANERADWARGQSVEVVRKHAMSTQYEPEYSLFPYVLLRISVRTDYLYLVSYRLVSSRVNFLSSLNARTYADGCEMCDATHENSGCIVSIARDWLEPDVVVRWDEMRWGETDAEASIYSAIQSLRCEEKKSTEQNGTLHASRRDEADSNR